MKKSIVELFTYAAAASFFALPPYGLAAHWYGGVLLAVSVLPAVGMSLLLTKFCRSGIPAAVRFAPVAAGWFALAFANRHLAGSVDSAGPALNGLRVASRVQGSLNDNSDRHCLDDRNCNSIA